LLPLLPLVLPLLLFCPILSGASALSSGRIELLPASHALAVVVWSSCGHRSGVFGDGQT
jgi:hypothetical protein